jgi:hypothetical protein
MSKAISIEQTKPQTNLIPNLWRMGMDLDPRLNFTRQSPSLDLTKHPAKTSY